MDRTQFEVDCQALGWLQKAQDCEAHMRRIAGLLGCSVREIPQTLDRLVNEVERLEKERATLKKALTSRGIE